MEPSSCACCGLSSPSLKRCGSCKGVLYCAPPAPCQRTDWPLHKGLCRRPPPVSAAPLAADAAVRSQLISVVQLPERGEGTVSYSHITPGTALIAGEAPRVPPVLSQSLRSSHCACCFQPLSSSSHNPHPATSTTCHRFCSQSCLSFSPLFAFEQSLLAGLSSPPSPTVLLCLRLLHASFHDIKVSYQLSGLVGSHSCFPSNLRIDVANLSIGLLRLLSSSQNPDAEFRCHCSSLPPSHVHALFAKLSSNCFTVCLPDLSPLGTGLFLLGSKFNHSCSPSCCQSFVFSPSRSPPSLTVRSMRPIPPTEECTISYIDATVTTAARQQALQEGYYFTCACPLCQDVSRDAVVQGKAPSPARPAEEAVPSIPPSSPRLLASLASHPPCSSGRYAACATRLQECLDAGAWREALDVAIAAETAVLSLTGDFEPRRAVHFFMVAKLVGVALERGEARRGERERGGDALVKAMDILRVCYGETNELFKEVQEFAQGA